MGAHADGLLKRWNVFCEGLVPTGASREIFDRLYAAYTAPDRHYHDIRHIADCLRELDAARHLARNPNALEQAIWFHDLIYDGRRKDNEERSAEMAAVELGRCNAPAALVDEARRLILLTRHDRAPDDPDGRLMVDIDLASLGRPAEVFDRNTELIRREYSHVSDSDFRRGRREMLGRFLARPRIYYTDFFFARYEDAARQNLERALTAI